ncbi:MAG: hypothetical protein HOP11_11745 [Saprospiraceae bacterium]|nr:hypothetical protein [Saprospiraceae bacterium]
MKDLEIFENSNYIDQFINLINELGTNEFKPHEILFNNMKKFIQDTDEFNNKVIELQKNDLEE